MKRTGLKRLSYADLIAKKREAESRARERAKAKKTRKPTKDEKAITPKVWSTKKADKLFSKWIRERDGHCYFCPNPATQNSHFWGRANSSVRYDPENCDGICGGCHLRHESNKQGLYREMKILQLGHDGYRALEQRARSSVKRLDAIKICMALLSESI